MRIIFILLLCCFFRVSYSQQKTQHTVYFEFDKSLLTATEKASLQSFIKEISQFPIAGILVKGYTDMNGKDDYNENLSQRRAAYVASALQEQLPLTIITTAFFGEKELISESEKEQHINRRVELVVTYVQRQEEKTQEVEGFYEDVEEQQFKINLNDTVIVTGKDGTTIKISPNSIQTKNGMLAKGEAIVLLKEYYQPADMVLAGMHSSSDEGLLQTGGMFRFLIVQKGDTMSASARKKVEIRMPVLRNDLQGMNVYVRKNDSDSAEWNNTKTEFTQIDRYWGWPAHPRLWYVHHWNRWEYTSLKIGNKMHEEYSIGAPLFGHKPYPKKVKLDVTKIDSVTLSVRAQIKYRRYGYKMLGIKRLDTTFQVKWVEKQYKAYVTNINWINCDRFYDTKDRTDLFVKTQGFKGMNVVLYFTRINSFMRATYKDGLYSVNKIPLNEKVIILAFGKDKTGYYLAKQPYLTDKNGLAKLNVNKVTKDKFENLTIGLDE